MASDEGAGGQVEHQAAIHLLVEVEVEAVEGSLWVAKLGLFSSSFQQALTATSELDVYKRQTDESGPFHKR